MTDAFDFLSLLRKDNDDFGSGFLVESERWRLPVRVSVAEDAGWLEFVYRESTRGSVRDLHAPLLRPMLLQFIEIARGDDPRDSNRLTGYPAKAIVFARRYGNLGICGAHNLPCWHRDPPCPAFFERRQNVLHVRERLAGWYTYSRLARAILNLVAKPQSPARRNDLNRLNRFFGRTVSGPVNAVNALLRGCRIDLRLHRKPPRLGLFPLPAGFGQIATQLALVVARRRAIALCDGCGRLFEVGRQPRSDRARYCKDCGIKAAWRDAQRRHRAKGM